MDSLHRLQQDQPYNMTPVSSAPEPQRMKWPLVVMGLRKFVSAAVGNSETPTCCLILPVTPRWDWCGRNHNRSRQMPTIAAVWMSFIYLETSPYPVGQAGLPALASCVLGLACTCIHCLYGARVLDYECVPVHTILTEPVCWTMGVCLYTLFMEPVCWVLGVCLYTPSLRSKPALLWHLLCSYLRFVFFSLNAANQKEFPSL